MVSHPAIRAIRSRLNVYGKIIYLIQLLWLLLIFFSLYSDTQLCMFALFRDFSVSISSNLRVMSFWQTMRHTVHWDAMHWAPSNEVHVDLLEFCFTACYIYLSNSTYCCYCYYGRCYSIGVIYITVDLFYGETTKKARIAIKLSCFFGHCCYFSLLR